MSFALNKRGCCCVINFTFQYGPQWQSVQLCYSRSTYCYPAHIALPSSSSLMLCSIDLEDFNCRVDPSAVLDFLWACLHNPSLWQGRVKKEAVINSYISMVKPVCLSVFCLSVSINVSVCFVCLSVCLCSAVCLHCMLLSLQGIDKESQLILTPSQLECLVDCILKEAAAACVGIELTGSSGSEKETEV